jgi:penicillin-binding protein 1A
VAQLLVLVGLVPIAMVAIYYAGVVFLTLSHTPDVSSLEAYAQAGGIQIFDRYDKLVCSVRGDDNRRRVKLAQMSPAVINAVLAQEDHTFFEHHGVSPIGIIRSALANLQAGHVVEGGSTITQQLAKNLFFEEPKRTLERKISEAVIAWELEERYSKNQILEMYLNEAYFGNNAYGIEQAARFYFGKSASRLGIPEAAFLAGLIKSPSRLGAADNRLIAFQEQQKVIDKMVRFGFISPERGEFAKNQALVTNEVWEKQQAQPIDKYPYYMSYVLDLVKQRFTPREMGRGIKVYTALDPVAQSIAEKQLRDGISHAPPGVTQGALVTVLVKDGSVVSMVGGVDYSKNQYNCATHPHTVGSAFKPFVYLAAIERGLIGPDSRLDDSPLVVKQAGSPDWAPRNFDHRFMGAVTARDALVYSRNVCTVRLAQEVGIPSVIDVAQRLGIHEKLDANLSLALGSSAVSPIEMAGAYSTLARGGLSIRPWVLRRVESSRGDILQVFQQPACLTVSPEPVNELVDVMHDVVLRGTAQQANLPHRYVAGKTGTSDQARDLWFIGFTPDVVTAVWGGNNNNTPIGGSHVTGGTVMAGLWGKYTSALYANDSLARNGIICKRGSLLQEEDPSRRYTVSRPLSAPLPTVPTDDAALEPQIPIADTPPPPVPKGGNPLLKPMKGIMDTSQEGDSAVRFKL